MGVKYIWNDKLMFGEKASKHSNKLIKKLEKGKILPDVFLVTMPIVRNNDLLEIYRSIELLQKHYDGIEVNVVAVAKGKDEAVGLVADIIGNMHKEQGDLDIYRYLDYDNRE